MPFLSCPFSLNPMAIETPASEQNQCHTGASLANRSLCESRPNRCNSAPRDLVTAKLVRTHSHSRHRFRRREPALPFEMQRLRLHKDPSGSCLTFELVLTPTGFYLSLKNMCGMPFCLCIRWQALVCVCVCIWIYVYVCVCVCGTCFSSG